MKAANFTLPSTNKKNFTLKESLGKYVVLYFYPKDDTPGDTNIFEEMDFTVGNTDTAESYTVTTTIDNNPYDD